MTTVISTINLKGGVAKTTTTVALADALSSEKGKRVLVIDLDPQTNATVMLIGEERWKALNDSEHTLARLFKDGLQPDARRFDIKSALQQDVGGTRPPYNGYSPGRVDLLPSSLDLIDVQDRLASIPPGPFYANQPVDLLYRAVNSKLADYDFVLIDCPPNLGIITLNGLRIATGYIIPTIPDILSTYGIPQIVRRVGKFSKEIGRDIHPLGIVVTKYQRGAAIHQDTLRRLREGDGDDARVFATTIKQANQIAAAAEHTQNKSTFRQKYGYQGIADAYLRLTNEVLQAVKETVNED